MSTTSPLPGAEEQAAAANANAAAMRMLHVALPADADDSDFSGSESDERDYVDPAEKTRPISDAKVVRHLTRMYEGLDDMSDAARARIVAKLPSALAKYRVYPRQLHTTLSKKYGAALPYEFGEWARAHSTPTDDWPVAMPDDPLVFLSFEVNGEPFMDRVAVQLFASVVPRTAENFRQLCVGVGSLGYRFSKVHRTEKGQLIQGGDITLGDGRGGASIYGPQFDDENFVLHHSCPGVLSMANRGPNTQNSQWFLTLGALPSLDGRHVCFGRVAELKGMKTLFKLAALDAADCDIRISDCGELTKL